MIILDRMNLRPMPVFAPADPAPSPSPAPAPAPAPAPRSALESGGEDDPAPSPAPSPAPAPSPDALADLPENWRDFIAGDDEALKNELGRVKSPKDLGKRLKDMREKLSKGLDPNEAPPEDEAKLKEWRAARGIPDKAADYKVPETIKPQIRDVDKPIVDGYMEFMHKRNATQGMIDSGLEYYFGMEAATAADRAEADKVQMRETTGTLKEMWGADFKANSQIAKRASEELVDGVRWFDARLPDGRSLGNVPEVSDLLVQLGLMKWGEGAYEGGKGGSDGVGDRVTELRAIMNKDIKVWRSHPEYAKELQGLLEQKEKRGGR
jgi:hypothetical protein